jgi:hypothetical protein
MSFREELENLSRIVRLKRQMGRLLRSECLELDIAIAKLLDNQRKEYDKEIFGNADQL